MNPKNAVESLREVVQDLLVSELTALKVSVESLREEMRMSKEAIRHEGEDQHRGASAGNKIQ